MTDDSVQPYVGRYAPSPTGMLHLGNLRTALAAYLHCRSRGGRFLMRIEDLDPHRVNQDLIDRQLNDLELLGLDWDEPPIWQSQRGEFYAPYLQRLIDSGLAYPCFASRREVREAASAPHREDQPLRYPGIYADYPRDKALKRIEAGEQYSWRLRVKDAPRVFRDEFAGEVPIDLDAEAGDFVIYRADGVFAYQMACALDDALTGITDVLRGGDLLDSGARQAWVLTCLGLPVPRYLHIPLFMSATGDRLSKRAKADDLSHYLEEGFDILAIRSYLAHTLGQCEPGERLTMPDLIARFDLNKIPRHDVRFNPAALQRFRS